MPTLTHKGKKFVEWEADEKPGITVAEIIEATKEEFPGIPLEKLHVFVMEAPGYDTVIQVTDQPEPYRYW